MKTAAIIIGSLALIATFSLPAEARVDYRDSIQVNARSGMNGNISVGPSSGNSTVTLQTVPGRVIEFARDKDGHWWPSRSLSR